MRSSWRPSVALERDESMTVLARERASAWSALSLVARERAAVSGSSSMDWTIPQLSAVGASTFWWKRMTCLARGPPMRSERRVQPADGQMEAS